MSRKTIRAAYEVLLGCTMNPEISRHLDVKTVEAVAKALNAMLPSDACTKDGGEGHASEPVWLWTAPGGNFGWTDRWDVAKHLPFELTKLYRHTPAQAPVVLSEQLIQAIEKEQVRLSAEDYLMDSGDCIAVIREELKRLNPIL